MELTVREKEVLMMFGCTKRKLTHERLTYACMYLVDPLTKAAANSLRNKIYEMLCDTWYKRLYCRTREEMSELKRRGAAA